jgi:hypothetical protein
MNRVEEVAHYRSAFRQCSEMTKIELVRSLRDKAIERVTPVLAELPRPMSDEARETYFADGVSTEWKLTDTEDAIQFFLVANGADVSSSVKSAAQLLSACALILENPSLFPQMEYMLLDAYAGIEHDNIEYGQKHRTLQKAKAKKPRGKLSDSGLTIQGILEELALNPEHQELKAKELWRHLWSRLDGMGLSPVEEANEASPENPKYRYENENGAPRHISLKHFANLVAGARKRARPPKISEQPG